MGRGSGIVASLVLVGCASPTHQMVEWRKVEDVDAVCRSIAPRKQVKDGQVVNGCAQQFVLTNGCVIYTAYGPSYEVLGHELRHCFEGEFHE